MTWKRRGEKENRFRVARAEREGKFTGKGGVEVRVTKTMGKGVSML